MALEALVAPGRLKYSRKVEKSNFFRRELRNTTKRMYDVRFQVNAKLDSHLKLAYISAFF